MNLGCVPIVNENDTVSFEEIEFGDNDTLAAHVAVLCDADLLINLSDIDGLYDSDPHQNPAAHLISTVSEITDEIRNCAGGAGSDFGTGGVVTKIHAAEISTNAGIPMLLLNEKIRNSSMSFLTENISEPYFIQKKNSTYVFR